MHYQVPEIGGHTCSGVASSAGDTDLRRAPRVDAAVLASPAGGAAAGVCASDARRRVVRGCAMAEPGASPSGASIPSFAYTTHWIMTL